MDWIEMSVETTSGGADAVSAILMRAGAGGAQIIDRADVPGPDQLAGCGGMIGDELIAGMPEQVTVKGWFSSLEDFKKAERALKSAERQIDFDMGTLRSSHHTVADEDWAENWKKYYHPTRVGKRLVIVPSWEHYDKKPDDLVISMDPGMAFGTGTHETTRLCLQMIERHHQPGMALDVGTGSGILAAAMALLGADHVLAVDIDPVAVKTARENAARNGLASQITVMQGDLTRDVSGCFSLVCANILADIIIKLAEPLKERLAPHARLIASGIIKDREGDVLAAFDQGGYTLIDRADMGEWLVLVYEYPLS